MNPTEKLIAGCKILDPALIPYEFVYTPGPEGQGSGGRFASGAYVRADRRLELHFRYSLGLISYQLGELTLAHEEYMRGVLQGRPGAQYPGFADDPLEGFRHLRHDLETFAQDFVSGNGDGFRAAGAWVAAHPRPTGFRTLSAEGAP